MATRAIINIIGEEGTVGLYRHLDGYPETVMPEIMEAVKKGDHRSGNTASWLIIGAALSPDDSMGGWKASSYEPVEPDQDLGGMLAYMYIIDFKRGIITAKGADGSHEKIEIKGE